MPLLPSREKNPLHKYRSNFDGTIAVDSSDAYQSLLYINTPGLSVGSFKFVEGPVNTNFAIFGNSQL